MGRHYADTNVRPDPDQELVDIANYVCDYDITSAEAYDTARYCLMDSRGCALLALQYPECTKHLGPIVQGTVVPHGAKVPGTSFQLDPVIRPPGTSARWSAGSTSTTWLAAEWGHPSDNLGAILGVADWLSHKAVFSSKMKPVHHSVDAWKNTAT